MPQFKRCKHCGKRIAEREYGSGFRWEHVLWVGSSPTFNGVWCQTTQAGPRRKRAQ